MPTAVALDAMHKVREPPKKPSSVPPTVARAHTDSKKNTAYKGDTLLQIGTDALGASGTGGVSA